LGDLLYITGIVVLMGLIYTAIRHDSIEKNRILALTIIAVFCIFFFACSLQTATSLTLFIERYVNRDWFGIQMPTMVFLSLQPLFIIVLAPAVARIWLKLKYHRLEPVVPFKIAMGLL